jgi:O-antigen/teichoic acid export membrane protein
MAPDLTVVLFGARWAESGSVAGVLFLIGPVLSVQAFSDSLLNAAGHPGTVLRFRLLTAVGNVLGFAIAVRFGILAVAAAFVVRGYLLLPLLVTWMRTRGGIPVREFFLHLRGVALATTVMAAAMLAAGLVAAMLAPGEELPALIAKAGAAVPVFVATLWTADRSALADFGVLLRHAGRAPDPGTSELRREPRSR